MKSPIAYTATDVISFLKKQVDQKGQSNYAAELKVPVSVLCQTLSGKRRISPAVVRAAGFEVRYIVVRSGGA